MRVDVLGGENPDLAVVGLIHGDEPAGKKAIEKAKKELDLQKPVKFILANEKAFEKDKRFIDTDLNRSFPGDEESSQHEERLAAKILEEVRNCTVLDLHTTMSYSRPFVSLKSIKEDLIRLASATGAKKAVYFPDKSGTMMEHAEGVLVEAGRQKTDKAAENAFKIIENFLAFHDAVDKEKVSNNLEVFKFTEKVEGDWNFKAENFSKVEKGEVYASRGNEELVAEEDFYPVLMSTNGYNGMLGYKAEKLGEKEL